MPLRWLRGERARLALLLLAISASLHFFRLSEPDSVVFDEVHFGSFVSAYVGSGAYFFDVHPPHAKLLVAGVAYLGGYRGDQEFGVIHIRMTKVRPALLRFVPALTGSLVPLLVYLLLLQLGASRFAALLGGVALAFDNALLIQTRILALDGVLLASTLGALSCGLVALEARGGRRVAWTAACGILVGLAVGTKFTGLAALGIVGVCGLAAWWRERTAAALGRLSLDAGILLVVAAGVYALGWWLHFALLPEPGPGDVWGAPSGSWWSETLAVHARMWSANANLSAGHPYASAWWSWPLMLRAISYWSGEGSHLFFLGNPVVWWGAALGLLLVFAARPLLAGTDLALRGDGQAWPPRLWIPLTGWMIAYLPLVGVARILFAYHYLTALAFSVVSVVLWLDHLGWTRPGGWSEQRRGPKLVVVALLIGFFLISPFTLSYVRAPTYQQAVFTVLPGWR